MSKEAGDSEQGVDHSDGVHRASRLAALSALTHLSHHLSCPRSVENLHDQASDPDGMDRPGLRDLDQSDGLEEGHNFTYEH